MHPISHRLLSALVCAVLFLGLPFAAFATDSSSDTAQNGSTDATVSGAAQNDSTGTAVSPTSNVDADTQANITDNPDLSDAEKQQWMEWASEEATDASADDNGNDGLADDLQSALDDADQTGDVNVDDLELNAALPTNVINILLLGLDNRSVKLESGLSDAVIICSVNTDDGSVKLTSITRDTEVVIPGYKNTKRINCAFRFGSKDGDLGKGAALAMKTVNRNFQMNIQRYVVVNIHGLASIIDALGGVDLDMSTKESSRINFELRKEPMDDVQRAKVKAMDGVQHLDGMQAVTYARIRGIDNDFMRTQRQRKLLETLMDQVMKNIDINKLVELIKTALPYGATNLTASDMISIGGLVIGGKAMSNLQSGGSVMEQFRMPMDDTWKYKNDNGATLTAFRSDAKKQMNIDAMQTFIYGQTYAAK